MYCLELFYRHGSRVKLRGEDQDKLSSYGMEAKDAGLLTAYRVVHIEAGKCVDYWKENENGQPAYRL